MAEVAQREQPYPPFVTSAEDRERWDFSQGIAEELFADLGAEQVWSATRAIYSSDLPTAAGATVPVDG